MALKKSIKQPDGIVTEYHRILYILSTINSNVSISVISYVDKQAREDEINQVIEMPYKIHKSYETDYIENMTIENAYNYLKTLDEFKDSEDI